MFSIKSKRLFLSSGRQTATACSCLQSLLVATGAAYHMPPELGSKEDTKIIEDFSHNCCDDLIFAELIVHECALSEELLNWIERLVSGLLVSCLLWLMPS